MKLSKHVRYLVRIRDYETVQIEVGAEVDHFDLGYNDVLWANARDKKTVLISEMEDLLNAEVSKLARQELRTVVQWSEISPNLAENYLATVSSAGSQNARTKKTATSSRLSRT